MTVELLRCGDGPASHFSLRCAAAEEEEEAASVHLPQNKRRSFDEQRTPAKVKNEG